MPQADVPQDHLTDYERAVCYYTLPRLNNPVSLGLIMVYAFCLLEALCVIAYGNWFGNPDFVFWGIIAFILLVAFGIVIFLLRDLSNDIRTRRALAQTRGVPDAPRDSSLPDPFASHVLIKHPTNMQGKLFACTQDDLSIAYFVDSTPDQDWWKITDSYDQEICRVKAVGKIGSFIFNAGLPSTLEVYVNEQLKATVFPRYSFTSASIVIQRVNSNPDKYTIRDRGIYANDLLVGRVYLLRKSLYLDIHRDHLNESTLAYFVTLD